MNTEQRIAKNTGVLLISQIASYILGFFFIIQTLRKFDQNASQQTLRKFDQNLFFKKKPLLKKQKEENMLHDSFALAFTGFF